jgi:sugar lactone lactonase YvrE
MANKLMQRKSVKLVAKTAAPDGMIFDENGTLYFADLENNKLCTANKMAVFTHGR